MLKFSFCVLFSYGIAAISTEGGAGRTVDQAGRSDPEKDSCLSTLPAYKISAHLANKIGEAFAV